MSIENPEKKSANPTEIIQNKKEKEFSADEKRQISLAWQELVIGAENAPENIELMDEAEIKKWFSDSLNIAIDDLLEKWEVRIDQGLIDKIVDSKSIKEKSEAQIEYIEDCYDQIQRLVSEFEERSNKSTKWNSWPKTMRQHKSFNCVGASLLGQRLLEKVGIKNYFGNPTGHVLVVARLENGDWWYADFLNGGWGMKKIEPEEIEIEGNFALKIDDSQLTYRYLGMKSASQAPAFIIGNLGCLAYDANSDDIPDEDTDKIAAKNFFVEHEELFKMINFDDLFSRLYPNLQRFSASQEMKNEKKRIDLLFSSHDDIQEMIEKQKLNKNIQEIRADFKKNVEKVVSFLMTDDEKSISFLNEESRKILKIYGHQLQRVKEIDVDVYEELKGRMIESISSRA